MIIFNEYIFKKIIYYRLLERIQNEDPNLRETGSAFINSVTRLLERLLDYRSVIHGDENRDKRMSCTVNLLVSYIFVRLHIFLPFQFLNFF